MMDQVQRKLFNKFMIRRTVQLFLSVSVFSIFVWYSSGFYILPQYSFIAYFSTCLFSMLAHTLERKYMFLICNAILAFIAKKSLLSSSSPPISAFDIDFQVSILCQTKEPVSEVEKREEYYEEVSELAEEEEEDGTLLLTETEGREKEASIAKEGAKGEDEEDEEGGTGIGVTVTQDDKLVDTTMAANEELANTEELNRKFEEFIRKMKEEIRIEAQTQPIAV